MIPFEYLLLGVAVLLLLSVVSSKASTQLGVPALLLFLVIGMLAGADGPGGVDFDNPWLAQSLGTVALIFILFSGGLDTRWSEVNMGPIRSGLIRSMTEAGPSRDAPPEAWGSPSKARVRLPSPHLRRREARRNYIELIEPASEPHKVNLHPKR